MIQKGKLMTTTATIAATTTNLCSIFRNAFLRRIAFHNAQVSIANFWIKSWMDSLNTLFHTLVKWQIISQMLIVNLSQNLMIFPKLVTIACSSCRVQVPILASQLILSYPWIRCYYYFLLTGHASKAFQSVVTLIWMRIDVDNSVHFDSMDNNKKVVNLDFKIFLIFPGDLNQTLTKTVHPKSFSFEQVCVTNCVTKLQRLSFDRFCCCSNALRNVKNIPFRSQVANLLQVYEKLLNISKIFLVKYC